MSVRHEELSLPAANARCHSVVYYLMRHDFIDRFSRNQSPIHRLSAPLKAGTALALIIVVVTAPMGAWWLFGVAALFLASIVLLSRIPVLFVLSRVLLLEPFALGGAMLSLFQPAGAVVFATLMVKSTLCIATIVLLSNTMPFAALLNLLKKLGMPSLLVTTLGLMYRYIFVLVDEGERMRRARVSRTFSPNRRRRWSTLASVIGLLGIRSMERSERIFAAMRARGWQ